MKTIRSLWNRVNPKRAQRSRPDERHSPPLDEMLFHRTVSQFVRMFVVPDVRRRVGTGTVQASQLPLHVTGFRIVFGSHGKPEPSVEINEEVQLLLHVPVTRAVASGESLTLADMRGNEARLPTPVVDGSPVAYFLALSTYVEFLVFFDFRPNVPPHMRSAPISKPPDLEEGAHFPVEGFVRLQRLVHEIRPFERLRQLAQLNWPPAPGHFPGVLQFLAGSPSQQDDGELLRVVSSAYSPGFWGQRLAFWEETGLLGPRLDHVRYAVEKHQAGDYRGAIHVLLPQFEGILRWYLAEVNALGHPRFRDCVDEFRTILFSREVLLFPKELIVSSVDFIRDGTFWARSGTIADPSEAVNRHGILHGQFVNFENEGISLKYLVLLDSLAYLILHDKMVRGEL